MARISKGLENILSQSVRGEFDGFAPFNRAGFVFWGVKLGFSSKTPHLSCGVVESTALQHLVSS